MSAVGDGRYLDAMAAKYARWKREDAARDLAAVGFTPHVVLDVQTGLRAARAALRTHAMPTIRDVAVVGYTAFGEGGVLAIVRDPVSGDVAAHCPRRRPFDAAAFARRVNLVTAIDYAEDGVVWRDAWGKWHLRGVELRDGDVIDRRIGPSPYHFQRGFFLVPGVDGARPRWRSTREPSEVLVIAEADLMQWSRHLREEWFSAPTP